MAGSFFHFPENIYSDFTQLLLANTFPSGQVMLEVWCQSCCHLKLKLFPFNQFGQIHFSVMKENVLFLSILV